MVAVPKWSRHDTCDAYIQQSELAETLWKRHAPLCNRHCNAFFTSNFVSSTMSLKLTGKTS